MAKMVVLLLTRRILADEMKWCVGVLRIKSTPSKHLYAFLSCSVKLLNGKTMSLSDYLSKNYLSSDKSKRKKKGSSGKTKKLIIDDGTANTIKRAEKSTTAAAQITTPKDSLPSSRAASKGWTVVGTEEVLIDSPMSEDQRPTMASGAKAGLQTGADVAAQIRAKEQKELKILEQMAKDNAGAESETVYRDASGRKVDMKTRVEERKREREEQEREKERKKRDLNMGLVQKLELEQRKKRLDEAKDGALAGYADDAERNEELKRKAMEDDPMASFIPLKENKYVSVTGRKLYKGSYPENRFGIAPGHRWDGVNRSNGFEQMYFKKQVENERLKTLSYTMQEDY